MTISTIIKSNDEAKACVSAISKFAIGWLSNIWSVLGIPEVIVDDPHFLIGISKGFYLGSDYPEYFHEKIISTKAILVDRQEAICLMETGRIYLVFAKLTDYYGKEATINLFQWILRNYESEKTAFLVNWASIFIRIKKIKDKLPASFTETEADKITYLIENHLENFQKTEARLNSILVEITVGDLSKDDLESLFELTGETDFRQSLDLLNFELIINQNFAYSIWLEFKNTFEVSLLDKIAEFGFTEFDSQVVFPDEKTIKNYACVI
jgi:hypothetical protein